MKRKRRILTKSHAPGKENTLPSAATNGSMGNLLTTVIREAKRLLTRLDPKAEEFTFQIFKDDRSGGARIIHGALDDVAEQLIQLNQEGHGIFVTVNETDLKGRRLENILRIRCVWQEDDDGFDGELPLQPHIVVESSPGKWHRYFLTNYDILEHFRPIMERMVQDYGSDPNAKDLSRVLRLPGFFHQKPDKVTGEVNPFQVRIAEINDHDRYSWEEINQAFPPVKKQKKKNKIKQQAGQDTTDIPDKAFQYAMVYAALHHIDPECGYQEWLEIAMAIYHASGGGYEGFMLFEFWSMGGFTNKQVKNFTPGEPEEKWNSFSIGEITVGTLFKRAKENGWDGYYQLRPNEQSDIDAILLERKLFLNEFNRMHGIAMIQGQTVVVRSKPAQLGGVERELITVSSTRTYYENLKIPSIDRGEVGKEKLFPVWLESQTRRQYLYGARFHPEGGVIADNNLTLPDPVDGYLELYTGLAITPQKGNCSLILKHILEVWCCGNKRLYEYIINWLARMFQLPGKPAETAIVLRSGEGSGKNIIADIFAEAFGPHGGTYTKGGDITGRFSDHLATCVFAFLNEAIWGGDKQAEGTLKALITDKIITYEKKYLPKFSIRNCLHILMASNNDWVAPVGMDDRRYCYLDVSEKHKNDQEYFGLLFDQIKNGGKEAIVWHLLNHDISGFNPRVMPESQSETRKDNKIRTRGSVAQWWDDILDDGNITNDDVGLISSYEWEDNVDFIATGALHDHYLTWCKKHNERYLEKKQSFSKQLNELLPWDCRIRKNSKRGFNFPDLKTCRREWKEQLSK